MTSPFPPFPGKILSAVIEGLTRVSTGLSADCQRSRTCTWTTFDESGRKSVYLADLALALGFCILTDREKLAKSGSLCGMLIETGDRI